MKTTNYKKGDVVLLKEGNRYARFEYLGEVQGFGEVLNAYRPLDGKTEYATMKNDAGEFAPFYNKLSAEVVGLKWYDKVLQWWKASNRWKHFLFAIPLGAVCGAHFTTGVGLGMEVKDHLYGGKADFVDFALTAAGGFIGHGAMRLIGLDYGVMALINLIF
nr:MAG TPA: putative periplasmic lipoprotein [Bacteriophage sp.]